MKKSILALMLTTSFAALSAQSLPATSLPPELYPLPRPVVKEVTPRKQGFFYVRFMTAEGDLTDTSAVRPGLGVGYRTRAGDGAADLSFSGIGHRENDYGEVYWTAPKASYIHYLQPASDRSYYLGGGLAWGGIEREDHKFVGIIPTATMGYEFLRKGDVLGFTELNISQPTIAVYQDGRFPGPMAEMAVGVGF